MRQWLILFLSLICGSWVAQAQVLTPLNHLLPTAGKSSAGLFDLSQQRRATGDPLPLPFFDDFAQAEGAPDPERWLPRGGITVTNRFAVNPPSVYAATFDGLKADGRPYAGANAVGPTDTLTSQTLALGALQPQDSVYLSFYWQAGGLLDAPDFSSANLFFLQLEFKEANGSWSPVWTQKGSGRSTEFTPVMVALRESRYLYDGFQMRWVSSGSQNALRDVWHLDYVYLDRNRRRGQLQTTDVALTQRLPALLRRYTAMPLWQFLENPAGETRAQVGSELHNLSGVPAALSWRASVQNLSTGAVDTFLRGSAPVNPGARVPIAAAPSNAFLASQTQPYSLQTVLFLNTKEPNRYTRYNDTLLRQTDLQDFYAYDDGSAETGFSYPSSNMVQLAYQFDLNRPDRVKTVQIYFTGTNTPGTELFLRLWADNNGKPADQPLFEQRFAVPVSANLNAWLEIPLERQVAVQGRFYVGYRQPTGTTFVNVGFDLNEIADGKLFALNGPGPWGVVPNLGGALLFRPVMTGTLTSSGGGLIEEKPLLYPNPTAGNLYISEAVDLVEIFSVTGQLLLKKEKVRTGEELTLPPSLIRGIYFAKTRKGSQLRTTKIILQR